MSSSKKYKVAVVGCGKGGGVLGTHSIGYAHGTDWYDSPRADFVGACDLDPENLKRFCTHFEVPHGFVNIREMLATAQPEVVSICTYAGSHPQVLEACVEGGVKGIWCEKPFALSMDEARDMRDLCAENGVKLIVNHCRRPLEQFRKVRALLEAGAIGTPMLFASSIGNWDQMEWGTHWHDIFRMWAKDQPVEWVMGQARCGGEKFRYGHTMEDHSLGYYCFADGTRALLDGGVALPGDAALSVFGSEGVIHLTQKTMRVINRDGMTETEIPGLHPPAYGSEESLRIPHSLLDWMEGGPESELSVDNALKTTELYLAIYESAKRGDRIDLPLGTQADFPLDAVAARQKAQ